MTATGKGDALIFPHFLAERGLQPSMEKTRIVRIEKGFDFLGRHVRKYDGKLVIKPATAPAYPAVRRG